MTATTERTVPVVKTTIPAPTIPAPSTGARIALKHADVPAGLLDGAWWPRSRDLTRELPALAAVLDDRLGRITRVAVNPRNWPTIPRQVQVTGHLVKIGWFTPELDPHKILLLSYTVGRWDLLVIPPETGPGDAARLMAAATRPESALLTASDLMAAEQATEESEESWEDDGGSSGVVTAVLNGRAPGGR
ncbi:DUF5994 family protein [Streptomyces sp. NBC_01381]|uniref:DUF5994 family protein n=1 Tax=Streptomyces sp. NBC_01381 TaxID=2903845 RepID=UPI00224D4CE8|nr:DUF5994 family protein [Streptomyces sp. NBC_01381]MCX4665509.1 DUF5994 family protein [Streptomyces sp. NBC_01381]